MKAMSQQLQSDLCDAVATDQPQDRPPLPKLDVLAVDAYEETQQEWETEDDVMGGPLDLPIPTKVGPKPHVTVHVWCVRRCAMKGSNRQHFPSKLYGFYSVSRVRKTFFALSRAHFFADAVRGVYVRLPDEHPKAK